jgi:methyl-accepting chemotaxis protein
MIVKRLVAGSLMVKLMAFLLIISAAQILIIGFLSFQSAKSGLEQAALDKLDAERELRKNELLAYFQDTLQNIKFMAETSNSRSAIETLQSYHSYNKATPDTPFDATSELYKQMSSSIGPFFKSFLETHDAKFSGYEDLYLIGAADQLIMLTAMKSKEIGSNLSRGELKDSSLAKLCQVVLKTGKASTTDFEVYAPTGKPVMFMGAPILGDNRAVDGILALRIGPEKINSIFGSTAAIGKTTEAYLVGRDLLMRSQSRFAPDSAILRSKVDTDAAKSALNGNAGTGVLKNYQDTMVLTSYSPVGLPGIKELVPDFDWAVVAAVNSDEAFASIHSLRNRIILVALIIAGLSALVAVIVAGSVSKPIVALADKVTQIGEGDLTATIPFQTKSDEVGALAKAIHLMVGNLRDQIGSLIQGINVVSSAVSEISSSVGQVVTSSAQTSSAMTETTVTVEQLRRAAQLTNNMAKEVAKSAQEAVKTSAAGRQATDDAVKMITVIKEQMTSIGETVVRLSEHSMAIEKIIVSVQDIADQSNLLAVNASIEAARAGEHGKGFAVVAHEIKTLSDESKQSTEQVRTILEEIRKWVAAVVMAAEQGGKAVEAGVDQSVTAGTSIEKLYSSVENSAKAANEIQLSSDQQSTSIDQVSSAMTSIESAMRQNVDSASQLETAAKRLTELGDQLKRLVDRYRIDAVG